MKQWIKNNLLILIGGIAGGVLGYLYYIFIGCNNESCSIASSPYLSALWGGAMGSLLFSFFDKKK